MPAPGWRRRKKPSMFEPPFQQILRDLSRSAPSTPEFRLLLDCSFVPPASIEPGYLSRTRDLCSATGPGAIDWDEFVELVDRHRIPILAYAMLRRRAWEFVPERIKQELVERYKVFHRQTIGIAVELVKVAKLFALNAIELLPLKGPPLSVELYGDPGMRQTVDLDLMVKPEDLDQADAILLNEGYQRIYPEFNLTEGQKRVLLFAGHHYIYRHVQMPVTIELHWSLHLWRPEHVTELWKRSRPVEWAGTRFRELDEEMLLLFLCDHGSQHLWCHVKWLGDVVALLSRCSSMDWARLGKTAERLGLWRCLSQAALLVLLFYETDTPEPLLALAAKEKQAARLARESLKSMSRTRQEYDTHSFSDKCRENFYLLGLRPKPPIQQQLQFLMLDLDLLRSVKLPDNMFWLYYLLRIPMYFGKHFLKSGE